MKINTITCHDVYNHGASLQAWALQTYLSKLGHDVEIIDYKPDYLSGRHLLWSISNPVYDRPVLKTLYLAAKLPRRLLGLKRKKLFDQFKEANLKVSPVGYRSFLELDGNSPVADAYIAGSDQIWNTMFPNGRDPSFYLDFVPDGKTRISYAASFGSDSIERDYVSFVESMVRKLNWVSVREESGVELLKKLGLDNAIHVCDPVFLLDQSDWNDIGQELVHGEYLLVYETELNNEMRRLARVIAQRLGLKVYGIGVKNAQYADKDCTLTGPNQFVALVKNARYVISNSFHGTALSVIFEKPFCVVPRSENINTRMIGFLADLELSGRLLLPGRSFEPLLDDIDYTLPREKLGHLVEQSKEFLQRSLKFRK